MSHSDAGPPTTPRTARRTLAVLGALTILLAACSAAATPGATPADRPSAPPGGVSIAAHGNAFDPKEVAVPAGKPFPILFWNGDAAPHNIRVLAATGGDTVFEGEIFRGTDSRTYNVPPLQPGRYPFRCDVHQEMTGTLVVG